MVITSGDVKMALKATKPVVAQNRLKLFLYGNAKIGKTTLALQFPTPYVIDTDGSTNKPKYVDLVVNGKGDAYITQDFDELMEQVKDLNNLKHHYKTLVIDSLTVFYDDLLEKCAVKLGTKFGIHYTEANRRIKHLIRLLLKLDMNVIITSQAKEKYGEKLEVLGTTFDCYKKMDYVFDLILEVQLRGEERVALVKGTRLSEFKEKDCFPCNYNEFSKRYSKEILERNTVSQEISTLEQVCEILRLIGLLKISPEIYQKWLDKAGAETWEEMPKDDIQKCIDFLESKIKGE